MDTSYLSQQVNTIVGQLHGLFDEIGIPNHDRDTREAEVGPADLASPVSIEPLLLTAPCTAALRSSIGGVAQPG